MTYFGGFLAATALALAAYGADTGAADFNGKYRPSALTGAEEAYLETLFPSSHAANLLLLKNGDLLCTWFSGTWEGNSDVAILLARLPKGSSQWGKPMVVDHHEGESYQNPVLFEAADGVLWLFHSTQGAGAGESHAKTLVTKSQDKGVHWTPPEVLFGEAGAFTREPLVVMPNGDWMLPLYTSSNNTSMMKISADHGAQWKNCPVPESAGYIQPDVVRSGNQYLAFFRSRAADFIYRATSADGCAWTAPQKTELPNNNASIQLARLANGHLVLVFDNSGPVSVAGVKRAGPRKPLSIALSKDDGATWGWVRDLETGEAPQAGTDPNRKEPGREEYSYPTVTQGTDGKINVAYTYQRKTIKAMRFDEKWIEAGKTVGTFRPKQ
jgi:predicted neuraminidase